MESYPQCLEVFSEEVDMLDGNYVGRRGFFDKLAFRNVWKFCLKIDFLSFVHIFVRITSKMLS